MASVGRSEPVPKQTLPNNLVVPNSFADSGFLFTLLVSFYLLLFFLFIITDTVAYSTGEPYRGVVCEGTRGLTLVRVPRAGDLIPGTPDCPRLHLD